jgi:hypothetical protein
VRTFSAVRIGLRFIVLAAFIQSALASGFGPANVYPADQGPVAAVADDVNHDGINDLLVLNNISNDVSVLIGNSDGSYQPPINYSVGGVSPVAMVDFDFNGDGNNDIAVVNNATNTVTILLSNGDGTFQQPEGYGLGTGVSPEAIQLAILTISGHFDLSVVNAFGGTNNGGNVAVLLGNGDGTFQPALNYDTLGAEPVSLAIWDFNNDGKLDLALANVASNSVSVLLGNGQGGFTGLGDYPAGSAPTSITIWGSFPSLAVTNTSSESMTILSPTGGGAFNHFRTFPLSADPIFITAGFLNHDKYEDLVLANSDNTVSIPLGKGHAPFITKPMTFSSCTSPKSIRVEDVNQDGFEDLILACSNGVGVMLNATP